MFYKFLRPKSYSVSLCFSVIQALKLSLSAPWIFAVCLIFTSLAILSAPQPSNAHDPARFFEFLEQDPLARQGAGKYILGRSYLLGLFHDQDQEKGLQLLKQAADKDYIPAKLLLAQAYEQGLANIEQDYPRAKHWYAQAADLNSEPARMKLESLRDIDTDQDFMLFQIALNHADRFAVRYALQNKGAQALDLNDNGRCDIFASRDLLPDSDRLQACYTAQGQLAHIQYRFPPRPEEEHLVLARVLENLRDKYGAAEVIRDNDDAPQHYSWEHRDIQIEFWQESLSRTVFLRYTVPWHQEELERELQAEEEQDWKLDPDYF